MHLPEVILAKADIKADHFIMMATNARNKRSNVMLTMFVLQLRGMHADGERWA